MKQEQEQNPGISSTSDTNEKSAKPAKAKPEKNLYEPYITPPILYHALRWLAIVIFATIARVRLNGIENVPTADISTQSSSLTSRI